jgi:DNA-binding Lrp family transcriptional regulator
MTAAQAYVLIQTDVGRSAQVAEEVGAIDGVIAAHNVTGNYDVIVLAEADSMDDLGRLVVNQIQLINGITRTTTCSVVHL